MKFVGGFNLITPWLVLRASEALVTEITSEPKLCLVFAVTRVDSALFRNNARAIDFPSGTEMRQTEAAGKKTLADKF